MPKLIDITGQKFGRLTVVRLSNKPKNHGAKWECACDCGKDALVESHNLRSGKTQSCGCLNTESSARRMIDRNAVRVRRKTTKRWGTPAYVSWNALMQRCTNPNHKNFPDYAGRGITVCKGWQSFDNFLADMGERPDDKTLDRINNDDGYHCGHCDDCKAHGWVANCRWATWSEQVKNRRNLPRKRRKVKAGA